MCPEQGTAAAAAAFQAVLVEYFDLALLAAEHALDTCRDIQQQIPAEKDHFAAQTWLEDDADGATTLFAPGAVSGEGDVRGQSWVVMVCSDYNGK